MSTTHVQDPANAPIGWIVKNDIGLYFTLTWWILVYSPLSRPATRLLRLWPIKVRVLKSLEDWVGLNHTRTDNCYVFEGVFSRYTMCTCIVLKGYVLAIPTQI
jgi:hypothetical protein